MNNVVLIGRLTKDPELAYGGQNSDIAVCRFTLAVEGTTADGLVRCEKSIVLWTTKD